MVKQVTSLGGSGLSDWLWQRVSAVIIAAYLIFIVAMILSQQNFSYAVWHGWFEHLGMKIFTLLALLSIVLHAWVGIWTVATDYIKCYVVRMCFLVLVLVGFFAWVIWGIQILWSV
jgi:succinate dehydrogenase / fumarate reductase membrane anchor subunit